MKKIRPHHIIISVLILFVAVHIILAIVPNNAQKLIAAIEDENVEKVRELLEKGVDPNKTDVIPSYFWIFLESAARRPLTVACETGNLEIVRLLIEHGATAEYDELTTDPLPRALINYHPDDMEIIKLLLENGATLEKRHGITPVVEAARMYPYQNGVYDEETAKGITEIVKMLLGDQSVNTLYGSETLLFEAARAENVYLVEYLLSQGCDKNIQNYDGKTALDYAVERGYVEIVDLLS